ncbi:hypothetical protein FACS1894111_05990 [Clostridia bacterium]|nr:hypothetical protein FACS1894111_05990 [Clostridia bacterium]
MRRLTYYNEKFEIYDLNKNKLTSNVLERLGKYEDTGISPEQIHEMDKLYREKCEEVAELKELLQAEQKAHLSIEKGFHERVRELEGRDYV